MHGHRRLSSHSLCFVLFGMRSVREPRSEFYSTLEGNIHHAEDKPTGTMKMSLAESLACVVDESSRIQEEKKPQSRAEMKRLFELRIKRRVKEQFANGKFRELMAKVVFVPQTLQDAYNSLRVDSNVDISSEFDDISFESLAEELANGTFDIKANTFSVSTKGVHKEILVLPNLKLKVVQEAIRIVLEVVYRPHFLKISHGGRIGRGHSSAIKFICKEITNPNWWFTVILSKKLDAQVLDKLLSTMEDKVDDENLYGIIRTMFDAEVLNLEFGGFPKAHGLPQEGVLSTILMNIYLDILDHEFLRLSMRYEALVSGSDADENGSHSKLRSWFRRSLKDQNLDKKDEVKKSGARVYCCRFMDEIFLAVSGPEGIALSLKSNVRDFLKNDLHLDLGQDIEVLPCDGSTGIRFIGTLLKRTVQETPAVRAVHKLKEKVQAFASQKQEIWDSGTVRIGKKWLAHGLKKVKESEIQHLADNSSLLTEISCYRKFGMETDHWYKHLVKIWMNEMNLKSATDVEQILSRFIVEPSLPRELTESFLEFQKLAEEYVSSETKSLLALIPNSTSSGECNLVTTEVIAPVNVIKKRLFRYRLTNPKGYARASPLLVLLDSSEIIDWYSGLVRRWIKWYSECSNFDDLKLMISNEVRKSCVRTLATKYRIHEDEIEKRFDMELVGIPSTLGIENETLDFCGSRDDMAVTCYDGLCVLSLKRLVSQSRPCDCFVVGCSVATSCVYTLHVMERQKFPGWKTGFTSCIHPSLNRRRIGLCKQHVKDLFLGHISLQCIDFGSWK